MITVRPGGERGRTALRWLDSRHTFSFGDYYDRLPTQEEQVRLVRKLSWFEQQHRRVPTQEELVQIVQQLSLH